jgi:predicted CXXCH cytochrome family protein
LQRKLKASAGFSKGRALLQQALGLAVGAQRTALLNASAESLKEAQRLNPADREITYAAGLEQLARGDRQRAASNLAAVYSAGGDLAPKALDYLRIIFRSLPAGPSAGFEDFLQQARARAASAEALALNVRGMAVDHASPAYSRIYLGSDGCAECHAAIYNEWSYTGMGTMLRPYAPQLVAGDFSSGNTFYVGQGESGEAGRKGNGTPSPTPFARMVIHDGRHYFEIRQTAGGWKRYPVDYIIGSKFQQAYATTLSNGAIHVFPIQYNLSQRRWINFWRVIDGPETERSDPANWEKLDNASSYQLNCAVCHTSQLRNLKGQGFDTNNLEFKEPGVGCEMCHGPAAQHAVDMAQNRFSAKAPLDPPVNFSQLGNRDFVAICAQCHMQSAIRKTGTGGELNYASSGEFFVRHTSSPLGDYSRKGFYRDGRLRQTTFIVEALERSKCFRSGQVSCGNCHDPHGHDSASNPTSVKFRDNPDLMCTGCHRQLVEGVRAAQHSHHALQSEGSRCVSCHMPRIMESLMFRSRTHQIDDIPNAEATQRFGQEESPNACLLCHRNQSAQWVRDRLRGWKRTEANAVEKPRLGQ